LDLGKIKKIRLTKIWRILIAVAGVCLIAVLLLLYRPLYYVPSVASDDNQVSPYFSHVLLPEIYNGLQTGEAFNITISQEGLNDVIGRLGWPKRTECMKISAPNVFFAKDAVIIAGPIEFKGIEIFIKVVVKPVIDESGLLSLPIKKIKLGAVSATTIGKVIGSRIWKQKTIEADSIDKNIGQLVSAGLLNNKPFDPVFKVKNGENVRIRQITIEAGKFTIGLEPFLRKKPATISQK